MTLKQFFDLMIVAFIVGFVSTLTLLIGKTIKKHNKNLFEFLLYLFCLIFLVIYLFLVIYQ